MFKNLVYAPNWVNIIYLYLYIYFYNPEKKEFELWIYNMSTNKNPKY